MNKIYTNKKDIIKQIKKMRVENTVLFDLINRSKQPNQVLYEMMHEIQETLVDMLEIVQEDA